MRASIRRPTDTTAGNADTIVWTNTDLGTLVMGNVLQYYTHYPYISGWNHNYQILYMCFTRCNHLDSMDPTRQPQTQNDSARQP